MKVHIAIARYSTRQHGLVTRSQLRGCGIDRRSVRRLVDAGALDALTADIFRVAAAPVTEHQRLLAAVLAAGFGGCLAFDSASGLWRAPGFQTEPTHVWRTRDRSSAPNALGVQHKSRRLPAVHVVRLFGIPTTTPTRNFLDQCARLDPTRAGRLLDNYMVRRLTNYALADRMVARMSRRGRTGLTLARALLEERGPGYVAPESNLERRAHEILRRAGLDDFERQVNVGDDVTWIGRVDLKHRVHPLIVEIQSDLYHLGLIDRRADRVRIDALVKAGFVVVEAAEPDIWHRPHVVVANVERGLELARAVRARSVA
jgi:hypothetical protein